MIFLLALLLAAPAHAADAPYTVPDKWLGVQPPPGYADAYWTTVDESQRINVYIRPRYTGGERTLDWIADEIAIMKSDAGLQTGKTRGELYGGKVWYYVDWKDARNKTRGRHYYLETEKGEIAEVALSAQEEVFLAADASQFDDFLASFSTKAR